MPYVPPGWVLMDHPSTIGTAIVRADSFTEVWEPLGWVVITFGAPDDYSGGLWDGGSAPVPIDLIQIRRDEEANWITTNPVLAAGEFGVVTDDITGDAIKVVVGDGVNVYTSALAFAVGAPTVDYASVSAAGAVMTNFATAAGFTFTSNDVTLIGDRATHLVTEHAARTFTVDHVLATTKVAAQGDGILLTPVGLSTTTFGVDDSVIRDFHYNANTLLVANVDDTPLPLTIPNGTFLGRRLAGNIEPLTFDDTNNVLGVFTSSARTVDPMPATAISSYVALDGIYGRCMFGRTMACTKLIVNIIGTGGIGTNICVAIYSNNGVAGRDARPLSRLASSGVVAAPAAGGFLEVPMTIFASGTSVDLKAGMWVYFWASSATTTISRLALNTWMANQDGFFHMQNSAVGGPAVAVPVSTQQTGFIMGKS